MTTRLVGNHGFSETKSHHHRGNTCSGRTCKCRIVFRISWHREGLHAIRLSREIAKAMKLIEKKQNRKEVTIGGGGTSPGDARKTKK